MNQVDSSNSISNLLEQAGHAIQVVWEHIFESCSDIQQHIGEIDLELNVEGWFASQTLD